MGGAVEVLAVRYATRRFRRSETFFRYHTYREPDGDLQMDFFFWVVRDGATTVLVDTGSHPEALARRPAIEALVTPVDALRELGIDPADVSRVIATHFHFDHIGNVSAFPNARFTVQRRELEFWTGIYGRRPPQAFSSERAEIACLESALAEGRLDVVDGDAEVTDAISIRLVGGHCPGQVLTMVDGGRIVLTSDAIHMYEEMERDMPYELFTDLVELYRTYAELRRLRDEGAVIVAGHDPLVMSRFTPTKDRGGTLAVRIA